MAKPLPYRKTSWQLWWLVNHDNCLFAVAIGSVPTYSDGSKMFRACFDWTRRKSQGQPVVFWWDPKIINLILMIWSLLHQQHFVLFILQCTFISRRDCDSSLPSMQRARYSNRGRLFGAGQDAHAQAEGWWSCKNFILHYSPAIALSNISFLSVGCSGTMLIASYYLEQGGLNLEQLIVTKSQLF